MIETSSGRTQCSPLAEDGLQWREERRERQGAAGRPARGDERGGRRCLSWVGETRAQGRVAGARRGGCDVRPRRSGNKEAEEEEEEEEERKSV